MEHQAFYIIMALVVAFFIYSVFTKSGKGRLFGGKIVGTLNDSIIQREGILKTTIKIHLIEKEHGEKVVGVELTENAILSWSRMPISFTKSEAQQLVVMLNEAINKT